MSMTMNEIYEEILKDGGMTPSKKIKDTSIRFPNKKCPLVIWINDRALLF